VTPLDAEFIKNLYLESSNIVPPTEEKTDSQTSWTDFTASSSETGIRIEPIMPGESPRNNKKDQNEEKIDPLEKYRKPAEKTIDPLEIYKKKVEEKIDPLEKYKVKKVDSLEMFKVKKA
jgi:hypothetical protein